MEDKKHAMFNEAIGLLLSKWSALQIAVSDDRHKTLQIQSDVFSWFNLPAGPLDTEDLKSKLYNVFLSLSTSVEDNSVEQVADKLMIVHQECMDGNFKSIDVIRDSKPPRRIPDSIVQQLPFGRIVESEMTTMMMAPREHVRQSQSFKAYRKGLKSILDKWSFLQDQVLKGLLWHNNVQKIKAVIISFFTANSDPNIQDLACKLVETLMELHIMYIPIDLSKVAGELLVIWQDCFLDESNHKTFSTDKFEERVEVCLSSCSEISLADFQFDKTEHLLYTGLCPFFLKNTEPNVDDVAMMLCEEISTKLETPVEIGSCKQVARELLNWHQDYLNNHAANNVVE